MFKYVFWFLLFFNGGFLTGGATAPLAPPLATAMLELSRVLHMVAVPSRRRWRTGMKKDEGGEGGEVTTAGHFWPDIYSWFNTYCHNTAAKRRSCTNCNCCNSDVIHACLIWADSYPADSIPSETERGTVRDCAVGEVPFPFRRLAPPAPVEINKVAQTRAVLSDEISPHNEITILFLGAFTRTVGM